MINIEVGLSLEYDGPIYYTYSFVVSDYYKALCNKEYCILYKLDAYTLFRELVGALNEDICMKAEAGIIAYEQKWFYYKDVFLDGTCMDDIGELVGYI